MSAELSKQHFPLRRLHNWYLIASSLGVTNITFQILGNAFYSGARIGSIEFEDLWLMFHQKWLNMNLLVIWCLQVHACSFNLLNTLLLYTVLIHFFGMVFVCRMQSMDNEKLGDKSMIGILDPTCVNQVSYTITLNKDSEMYRNMSQGDFDKQVKELTCIARLKIVLYIAKAIQAFVKDDKFLIKIPYFLK
jgi:hypothetical protein